MHTDVCYQLTDLNNAAILLPFFVSCSECNISKVIYEQHFEGILCIMHLNVSVVTYLRSHI